MTDYGGQTMVEPLRRVLVRAPGRAFAGADPERWHYTGPPDAETAEAEHAALVELLEGAGARVVVHEEPLPEHADAMYVHDPGLVTDRGAILLRMGKALRRGEEEALGRTLEAAGVPILGRLVAPATAEGGDLLWLRENLLAVGLGYRTNEEGLRQLGALLEPGDVECLPVDLPHWKGEAACLHLMSLISMIDHDLAVAYRPLLPARFCRRLEAEGIEIVEVPPEELDSQGPNVLALAPRDCLLLEGNPRTAGRLEAAGCRVRTYRGEEISHRAEGGPTCLTRPLLRAAGRPDTD